VIKVRSAADRLLTGWVRDGISLGLANLTSGVLVGSQDRRENKRQQHEQQDMTMAA